MGAEDLHSIDAYWRAANYCSVGQIYLLDNPLLREPLRAEHVKPRLMGHFGTTPGLNLIYAHLNRVIVARDLDMIYVTGPGHGGPGIVANTYLEGTYSDFYPHITQDEEGLRKLFRQFSFPGGIPSHVSPGTPGSIHEGGELGYSLVHAYGAALDNPDLVVACVIGDGEAETGPLAGSWHSNKFLDPVGDGAVLPILHLNGWKIANPTILARIGDDELRWLLEGYGHRPIFVAGDEPFDVHEQLAAALDRALDEIADIQTTARRHTTSGRPVWPMIVLRTPKGWTGPKTVDGLPVEGTFRSHQVPVGDVRTNPEHLAVLEAWMRSYRSDELFDDAGRLRPELAALAPSGTRRMGANPHANGGLLLKDLAVPDFTDYAVPVDRPGTAWVEPTRVLGELLRDVIKANPTTFRLVGPDETVSNRLGAVFEATERVWEAELHPTDEHLATQGRVMEVLSEHLCEGWLEGYLLTGPPRSLQLLRGVRPDRRLHAQPTRQVAEDLPGHPLAPSDRLAELPPHEPRLAPGPQRVFAPGHRLHRPSGQQELGSGAHLPPPGRQHPALGRRPLLEEPRLRQSDRRRQAAGPHVPVHGGRGGPLHQRSRHLRVGEQRRRGDSRRRPCLRRGRSHARDARRSPAAPAAPPVAAGAGRQRGRPHAPLRPGCTPARPLRPEFDELFTTDRPVIFAYHGYPWLIHRLTYRRTNHANLHVRGYREEGTTTTPFDMTMLNDLDRFHLVMDVIDRVPGLGELAAGLRQEMQDARLRARAYTREYGEDPPEITDWVWSDYAP